MHEGSSSRPPYTEFFQGFQPKARGSKDFLAHPWPQSPQFRIPSTSNAISHSSFRQGNSAQGAAGSLQFQIYHPHNVIYHCPRGLIAWCEVLSYPGLRQLLQW
uniref:Uncharacterized protein n=1 Tax=Picea sitchensis TaxID=3332 RepID=A9NM14_PICSI|nr:unknown [Picea sitchensis]